MSSECLTMGSWDKPLVEIMIHRIFWILGCPSRDDGIVLFSYNPQTSYSDTAMAHLRVNNFMLMNRIYLLCQLWILGMSPAPLSNDRYCYKSYSPIIKSNIPPTCICPTDSSLFSLAGEAYLNISIFIYKEKNQLTAELMNIIFLELYSLSLFNWLVLLYTAFKFEIFYLDNSLCF